MGRERSAASGLRSGQETARAEERGVPKPGAELVLEGHHELVGLVLELYVAPAHVEDDLDALDVHAELLDERPRDPELVRFHGGDDALLVERGARADELVLEHPVFKREGDDLHVEVPITVPEAIAGATVKFPTPSGEVSLKIPPGTQSGRRFRLRGLGVSSKNGKGDLYARVAVHVPDKDGPEAREIAQQLAPFYTRDPRSELHL